MERQAGRMQELTSSSEVGQVGDEEKRTVSCDQQHSM